MMMLACLVLSIIVGYARRGKLSYYLENPLRGLWLPIVAYALEFSFGALENILPWPPSSWLGIAVCVEYALVFAFVWLNRARRSFWAIAAGSILNFVVIAANGFRMPISPVVYDYPQFANIIERVGGGEVV